MNYLNLVAKERNALAWPNYFGRLYGEGAFVVARSNFKFPRNRSRYGNNPLTITQTYRELVRPLRFAEAEARARR